jgi:hypothetical protein
MLIYDLVDPQELQGFVRGVQQELERNTFVLQQFLPNDNIDDIEWRMPKGVLTDEDAAVIRAWDTESPIGNRQGISRIMGELPPISKKWRLGEEERLRQRKLLTGDSAPIVRAIYDDAAKGARAITARVELLRGEALVNGTLSINENGVVQTVDFDRKSTHDNANVTTLWTVANAATADPIKDMLAMQDTYVDTNGVKPALQLTSTTVITSLLVNDKIRTLASSLAGAPSIVSLSTLQSVISAFGLAPLVPYDVKVRVNGSATNVINPNKLILLPPANEPLGRTFFGTTAEALELAEAKQIEQAQAPGMVSVVEKTTDPVATWTKTAAIALPVLANPDLTLVRTVQ